MTRCVYGPIHVNWSTDRFYCVSDGAHYVWPFLAYIYSRVIFFMLPDIDLHT